MSEQLVTPVSGTSFPDFLFKNRKNRATLWLATAAIVLQFSIFKYLYPYASFIHGDSFSYINAADKNLTINTYLIGYSKFLRLFSVFSKSDFLLVSFQYLFIEASALFLVFTLFYFYKTAKSTKFILLGIVILNPLFLHLANLVSSDGIFMALSFLWLATLLWLIEKRSRNVIIWHTIILFIAFTFRYNALIYPLISVAVLYLSKMSLQRKLLAIAICLLPIGGFYLLTSYQYKKLTGYWQYSPFSGWQLANNAMYSFRYVDSANRKPVPEKFKPLHNMVCEYFDSTRNVARFPIEFLEASTFYMWSPKLTLVKYKEKVFQKDSTAKELKKWASMGPIYKEYGSFIIKEYPKMFLYHFIWPNSKKYFAPPVEFLEEYNSGKDSVTSQAKRWFGYETGKVTTRLKNKDVYILTPIPIISGIANSVLVCVILCYSFLGQWKNRQFINKTIMICFSIWLVNAIFTISASSAALRFQSFPFMLSLILSTCIIDWMVQLMNNYTRIPTAESVSQLHNQTELANIQTF